MKYLQITSSDIASHYIAADKIVAIKIEVYGVEITTLDGKTHEYPDTDNDLCLEWTDEPFPQAEGSFSHQEAP